MKFIINIVPIKDDKPCCYQDYNRVKEREY